MNPKLYDEMGEKRPAAMANSTTVRASLYICSLLLCVTSLVGLGNAQSTNLVLSPVDAANRVALKGHHPIWAGTQNDLGAVPADMKLEQLTIVLNRSPQVEKAYTQFLADQQNPKSPNYHHWLTPVETGQRFGVSAHDIAAVKSWLESQSLTIDSVSNSRVRITFSGTAASVGNAFGREMHYFQVGAEKRISIAGDPQIPAALSGVVHVVSGLSTVHVQPQHRMKIIESPGGVPEGTLSDGSHVIFPADFVTLYNLSGGFNGSGQQIAIIGRSRVCTADITNFASLAGVTIQGPTVIVPPTGIDPGSALCTGNASGDQAEATLDVTRSGSIAQGANILLVISQDGATTDGIQTAATYVVDKSPVPAHVMSISFGLCEAAAPSEATFYDSLFQQGAGEGISVMVSSGDSAAAGCDTSFATPPAVASLAAPNLICSSGYGTCVGGTEFNDATNPSLYWSPNNSATFGSALSYIPEGAWNEPLNGSNQLQVAGTGGGVSLVIIPTPTWQVGTGVPSARAGRYVPDVSFSSSGHDAYFGCMAASGGGGGGCVVSNGGFSFVEFSGTSAAAPDMAGITAILNQSQGAVQGQLNPKLYRLAAEQVTFNAFNDVTVASSGVAGCVVTTPSICNNSVASSTGLTGGTQGFLVNAGYDEATGLGSINVANLLTGWASNLVPSQLGLTTSASQVLPGVNVMFTATVTPFSGTGTPTGNVAFVDGTTQLGTSPISGGSAVFNTSTLSVGLHSISAIYQGDTTFAGSTTSLSQTVGTISQTTLQTSAAQIAQGKTVTLTATVAPTSGTGTPTGTVTFTSGGTTVGTGMLSGGVATTQWTPPNAGTYSVNAVYSGDTTFVGSTSSAISQSVVNLSVSANPASLTLTAGGNQTVSFLVTPSAGYSPTVSVTCTGAPSESTCTAGTPTTSNGVQTWPVSITTTAAHNLRQVPPLGMFIPMGLFLPIGALFATSRGKRAWRGLGWLGLMLVLTMSTLWLCACGGSSPQKDPGTPAGTYSLTVTATTSDNLAIKQSVNVQLTVQ